MPQPQLTASEVEFEVSLEPDEFPDGEVFHTDNDEADRETEALIRLRLERGQTEAWCSVVVTAKYEGPLAPSGLQGHASLGGVNLFDDSAIRSGDQVDREVKRYAREEGLYGEALDALNENLLKHIEQARRIVAAADEWKPRRS